MTVRTKSRSSPTGSLPSKRPGTSGRGKSIAEAREKLAIRLPELIDHALGSYEVLAAVAPATAAKDAAKHHTACRAALSHLDLLAKLARWAEGKEGAGMDREAEEDHDSLVARARAALEDLDDTGT